MHIQLSKRGVWGIILFSIIDPFYSATAQNIFVHAGGETVIYGNLDASTSIDAQWMTSRGSKPGYFTLINDGGFSNYSERTHINGYVKKYGNSAFSFPVGNSIELRELNISKPDLTSDAYAVAWIGGDPGINIDSTLPYAGPHPVDKVTDPIEEVSKTGQWDWQVGEAGNLGYLTTGSGQGIRITASIPDMSQFADKTALRLVGWNGKSWIDLSGRPSASGNGKNSKLTGIMIQGVSAIGIGRVKSIPAGRLEFLQASAVNCKTLLQWKTNTENITGPIIVEQSINDGAFYTVLKSNGYGMSKDSLFTFLVNQPHGVATYRIRYQDKDGSACLSPTASCQISCSEQNGMELYPNPVTYEPNIQVRVNSDYSGPAMLLIHTASGKKASSKIFHCKQGINQISLAVTDLPSGYYVIEVRNANGNTLAAPAQFIKQ